MPRKLDDAIANVLREYGFGADACWDCHGTWVVYHRVLEQIAVNAGIVLDPPQIIEANGKEGIATVCVTGRMGDKAIWSIGEAAPKNNKNAYPWAMAEKRAVDRVILKLIGLHGLAYSEEEADDFKADAPKPPKSTHGKLADDFAADREARSRNLERWEDYGLTEGQADKAMRKLGALIKSDADTPDEATLDAHLKDHHDLITAVMMCSTWWPSIENKIEERREAIRRQEAEGVRPEDAMAAG